MFELPDFWRKGSHFALFVGLTEGETDETSVLIRDANDVVHLSPPNEYDYETWSLAFLGECAKHLGPRVHLLSDQTVRSKIAASLRQHFKATPVAERIFRNWIKLAGLPAAICGPSHMNNSSAVTDRKALIAGSDAGMARASAP